MMTDARRPASTRNRHKNTGLATEETFHPLAWTAWLAAAALPALSTRNPLYLSITLLAVGITYTALGRRNPTARSWGAFVRFGAFLWLLTIPFTMLTSHGGTIVLFRLPRSWPIIGGAVTLEAFLYGLSGGLAIISLLLIFATFNIAVDQARLLRLTPGFLYQAGVVAGIAVAFVPTMVATWQSIREAQQVRGHKVRGVRDLLPLIMPLLVTALERAMNLAGSMESRGFGGQVLAVTPRQRLSHQLALLAGLALVGLGLAINAFWPDLALAGGLQVAGGLALMLWSFWDVGRRSRRTRYRRWPWTRLDRVVAALGLTGVTAWLMVMFLRPDWLHYYPYMPYSPWPTFNPVAGVVLLLLAVPGMLLPPVAGAPDEASEAITPA
jgi:energy-coupling factor transport system permease protein